VSGERRAIEHPLLIDFSRRVASPLKFVLQTTYSPAGIVERPSPGVTMSHTPWYTEVALELTGTDSVALLYLMRNDDESLLLAACLDDTFEPFFKFLSGADYGDSLTSLTAQHWPEVYAMLVTSNDSAAGGRVLGKVATPSGRVQWVIADDVPSSQVDSIASEQLLDLIGTSVQTVVRATSPWSELPGFIQVFDGPDQFDRRLKALSGLAGAGSDIGGALNGGIDAVELLKLGKAALDAVNDMIALRD
jgi:hypothetical protein